MTHDEQERLAEAYKSGDKAKIRRYFCWDESGQMEMTDGKYYGNLWVRDSDVAALEAELAELRTAIKKATDRVSQCADSDKHPDGGAFSEAMENLFVVCVKAIAAKEG